LERIEDDRFRLIEPLHHLGRQSVDRILYPAIFRVNEKRLARIVGRLADLRYTGIDTFAFGAGLCIELLLRTHFFKSADRSDTSDLEYGKWNVRVALCTLDRANDLVLGRLKILFG